MKPLRASRGRRGRGGRDARRAAGAATRRAALHHAQDPAEVLDEGLHHRNNADNSRRDRHRVRRTEALDILRGRCRGRRRHGSLSARIAAKSCRNRPRGVCPARNAQRSIGGDNTVFVPAYGNPFVFDLDKGRRYATSSRTTSSWPALRRACTTPAVPSTRRSISRSTSAISTWCTRTSSIPTRPSWVRSPRPSARRIRSR